MEVLNFKNNMIKIISKPVAVKLTNKRKVIILICFSITNKVEYISLYTGIFTRMLHMNRDVIHVWRWSVIHNMFV